MSKNIKAITLIPDKLQDTLLFRNVFIKEGNLERASRFISDLNALLKLTYRRGTLIRLKKIRKTKNLVKTKQIHKRPKPYQILNQLLYKLKPGFIIRRVIVAGKTYSLPVPITNHRASYLACNWLRKAVLSDTKSASTIPNLMLKELINLLKNKGEAVAQLRSYIAIAIDQRPFSRYIRKKRKKRNINYYHRVITNKTRKRYRQRRKIVRRLNYRTRRNEKRFRATKHYYKKSTVTVALVRAEENSYKLKSSRNRNKKENKKRIEKVGLKIKKLRAKLNVINKPKNSFRKRFK